tara:strand:+ start:5985 stop:6851 length:867 start_codon:yes stop_codon:yes gene_type:complete
MINKDKEYFDEGAEKWISDSYVENDSMAKIRLNMVNDLISRRGSISIMDIGCGDGRFLSKLDQTSRRVGVDFSKTMIKLAKTQNPEMLFSNIDLNDKSSLQQLSKFGTFDCITMMGVVHYLQKPSLTMPSIRNCLSKDAEFVISFRNRLFNINSHSKYHDSELTARDLSLLIQELEVWKQNEFLNIDMLEHIKQEPIGEKLLQISKNLDLFDGTNDDHWNPDGFDNWRQFTPFNAILLLEAAGLKSMSLIPLHENLVSLEKFSLMSSAEKVTKLLESSAFLIVATRAN